MTLEQRASVCTFDCPDACSLTVEVNDARIVKVRGSDALPYTAGVICNKVARYTGDFVHGQQRLLHPLRRIGLKGSGQFERISWEAARSEEHTSELQSRRDVVCRLLLEKKKPISSNADGTNDWRRSSGLRSRSRVC